MPADKILIIEDDPTMQEALRDNFEFGGYTVHVASDGRAGLKAALAHQPDLILLDIMLPGINGFDVCRRIRSEGLTIPIIMLTAKSQESDVIRGLDLGADARQEHVDAERFGDVIIGAQIETANHVRFLTLCRQHDDGNRETFAADPPAHVESIDPRQHVDGKESGIGRDSRSRSGRR